MARAKAIDEELGFGNEYQLPDLPVEEPCKRVEEFISSQLGESSPRGQKPSALRFTAPGFTANLIKEEKPRRQELNTPRFTVPGFPAKSVKKEKQDPLEELNPGASPSTPSQTVQFSNPADRMECFIQFMARRELIANKIEKFDARPENFNTWKAAFKNMTNDVNITASEELALMLEYTTGKSKIATATQCLRRESDCGGTRILEKAGRTFWLDRSYYQCASEQTHNVPCVGIQGQQRSARIGGLTVRVAVCKRRWWSAILDEPAFLKPVLAKLPKNSKEGGKGTHTVSNHSMVLTTPLLWSLPLSFKRLHKNGMIHSYPWRVTWRNFLSSLLSNLQSNLLMTHLSDKASQHLGLTSQTLHSRAQLTGTLQDGASFTNYRIRLANAVPSGPCPSLKGRICLANTESAFIALPQLIT